MVVNGVPGNDLATFMDGPTVIVNDNAQDGIGNTMNRGLVVVNGDAGDVLGYGMRGGRLYVKRRRRLPGGHPHEGLPGQAAGHRGRGPGA